ncbi:MAG: hypothetical protein J6B31_06995 [Bacteroidaceae bacterium]|nr:hypothetical protein [Bacteroidaceae bacterium]MBQ8888806.1 hypothetical protein [Bacteroidaceae bacterium]
MKKEMSIRISFKERIKLCINGWAETLAEAMSSCIEERISPSQALRILHAVIAFTVLVFSYTHALLSVLFLIWFVLTLIDCKRAGVSCRM